MRTVFLSDLLLLMRNGTTVEQNQDGRGFPVSRIETVSNGVIDADRVRHVELGDEELKRWRVEDGDILLSHINSEEHIGKSALYEGSPPILIHGMNLLLLRPDTSKVIPQYLHFALRSSSSREYIRSRCKRAVNQASINQKELGSLPVRIPSLRDQRRIVDVLSRAEGIVRLRQKAQKKAAEIIPALFLDMFGDPARNPKSWEVCSLGDLFSGAPVLGTMVKPSTSKAGWLDLRVANIQNGELRLNDKKWLELQPDMIDRFALRTGDLLLARAIGSLDHLGKAVIVEPDGNWTFDSHLMRLRLNQGRILPVFLKAFLESKSGRDEFLMHTRRSAVQFNINGKEVRQLRVPLPPVAEQKQFADRCRDIQALNAQQADSLDKAELIFTGLLSSVLLGDRPQRL